MGFNSPNSISTIQGFCSSNNDTMMASSSANSISPTTLGFSTGGSTSTSLFGIGSPSPVPLFGSPSPSPRPLFGSGAFFAASNGTLLSSSLSPSTSSLFRLRSKKKKTSAASAAPGFNFTSAPATLLCERCGHKVAAYTPSHDENGAAEINSISAMPIYEDKSHEELRWSVYQSQGWNKEFHKRAPISASTATAQPPVVIVPLMAFPVMPCYNFNGLGTSPWTPIWGVPAPSANSTLFGQGNSSGTAVTPGVASLCNMFRQL